MDGRLSPAEGGILERENKDFCALRLDEGLKTRSDTLNQIISNSFSIVVKETSTKTRCIVEIKSQRKCYTHQI